MNKLKLFVLPLLMSSTLYAQAPNQLYAAIDGGVFQGNFNNNYYDQTDVIPQNISNLSLQNGYTGGLAIGFVHTLNNSSFLALELSGNLDSNSALFQSGAASTAFSDQIKMRHHVDFTLIPGLITLGSYFPYLKLGVSYASLRDNLVSPVGYNPVMTPYYNNKSIYGFAAALGVKHAIGEHLGLFSEVGYHDYGNINLIGFENFSATYTHSTRLCSYSLVVGASYAINV